MDTHPLVQERLKKSAALREQGINPYPYRFETTTTAAGIREEFPKLKPEEKTGKNVAIAGRIMLMRNMGKATFGQLKDGSGQIQFFMRKDDLENYDTLKNVDLGDFIGIEGEVITTKTGELTVKVANWQLLTKAIRPLPEKHHGLQDMEARYRKRYLDLITNPESTSTFVKRSKIIKTIRKELDNQGFIEVETPTLQPVYGGAAAKPFTTIHNALKKQLFLRISDELYLKRLIVGGFDGVYEICKDFRNEGIDTSHNPEFTMLEWYQAYKDYNDGMALAEKIIAAAATATCGTTKITYQGKDIDLTPPWQRKTMAELIKEHAAIDVLSMEEKELKDFCTEHKVETENFFTWGLYVQAIFEHFCEDKLVQPTFVIDHPVETTPLCKQHREDPRLVERFELFIAGMELANAYSELNDPVRQKELLEAQVERREQGDDEAQPMDTDFVESLEYGMPPTSGVGIGIDRLVMILTNSASIRDVILFPAMK